MLYSKKAGLKKSLVHEKGEDIRIVTKQELLTSQILFNNLVQNFLRRIRKIYFYSVNPEKHENYTHKQQWRVRGRVTLFCLDEMVLWKKKLENRWNGIDGTGTLLFVVYDVLDLIFDRERPTPIFFVSQTTNNIIFLEFIQQKQLKCRNNLGKWRLNQEKLSGNLHLTQNNLLGSTDQLRAAEWLLKLVPASRIKPGLNMLLIYKYLVYLPWPTVLNMLI